MSVRQCPFCGKPIPIEARECPYCEEKLRAYVPDPERDPSVALLARARARRGLLWMLLAGAVYFFAAGYSPWKLPFAFHPMLAGWILPLLFLAGLGQFVYGVYRWFKP